MIEVKQMDYFPTKLAAGAAFCNREKEQEELLRCLDNVSPVLLISPRRYGKTSLAMHVLDKNKFLYVHIDFYKELSEEDIASAILNGIGRLLGKIEDTPEKILTLAKDFFSSFNIRAAIKTVGIEIEFEQKQKSPVNIIAEALEKLEELAVKKQKKLVLFMDEFQTLAEATNHHGIEAAIRHAAQESKHVCYLFSGSNRYLLKEMFQDRKRPLYKLCHTIHLKRIQPEHYIKYIQAVSQEIWGASISDKDFQLIFSLTQRHPYYVNKLCTLLSFQETVSNTIISSVWENYVLENRTSVEGEVSLLAVNQRKLLFAIARSKETKELLSKEFSHFISIVPGSIPRAATALRNKDYIYENEEGYYQIVDPLVHAVLNL